MCIRDSLSLVNALAVKPRAKRSRKKTQKVTGSSVILPSAKLAGVAKAKRPGSDLDRGQTISNTLNRYLATAVNSVRSRSDVNEIIRTLTREDGPVSYTHLRAHETPEHL